jgi:hypothetical protein
MKLKSLLVSLVVSVVCMADNGLNFTYKPPVVPLEFSFNEKGIEVAGAKEWVTPVGVFKLGYSEYVAEFEEDYTYVIIEDMNDRKEHIYKVREKQTLKLANNGRTGVEITKNRVRILVEKGSEFELSFEVIGDMHSYASSSKWLTPTSTTCTANGGEIDSDGFCYAPWEKAKTICSASGGSLPSVEELKEVVTGCGGTNTTYGDSDYDSIRDKNKANTSYQSCYKAQGFTSDDYWSATSLADGTNYAWIVYFGSGYTYSYRKGYSHYVRCVRAGQ